MIAGPGAVNGSASTIYSALSFDPFSSNRFQGFYGNPAYGTFRDPDRSRGVAVYDGSDGDNVTLRLWFIGVDFSSLGCLDSYRSAFFGAANVGQTNPCTATSATMWARWYDGAPSHSGRIYIFKSVQVNEAGYMGFGPARGWNPSNSGLAIENVFDLVLEFVPAASAGELRVYGFQKRYYSTETYHYAPGRWIPMQYTWGLTDHEVDPMIKDPSELGPQNRYYNKFSGYPYAQSMNVFAGIGSGGPADSLSWAQIKAEGTSCGASLVNNIAGAKKASISGVYDIGTTRITADFRATEGLMFVRQLDGSAGVAIRPDGITLPTQINVGDRVQASGYTKVEGGAEVVLAANQITISSPDPEDPPIKPVGLTGLSLGGGSMGCQKGVRNFMPEQYSTETYSGALNNIGLLVTVFGKVTYSTTGYFYVDDGCKLQDNSGHLGIKVLGTAPVGEGEDSVGRFVSVTGISSCFKAPTPDTDLYRLIRATEVVLGD